MRKEGSPAEKDGEATCRHLQVSSGFSLSCELLEAFIKFLKNIYLAVLTLSCGMWDTVP